MITESDRAFKAQRFVNCPLLGVDVREIDEGRVYKTKYFYLGRRDLIGVITFDGFAQLMASCQVRALDIKTLINHAVDGKYQKNSHNRKVDMKKFRKALLIRPRKFLNKGVLQNEQKGIGSTGKKATAKKATKVDS